MPVSIIIKETAKRADGRVQVWYSDAAVPGITYGALASSGDDLSIANAVQADIDGRKRGKDAHAGMTEKDILVALCTKAVARETKRGDADALAGAKAELEKLSPRALTVAG